jgi:hypothetical protein
MRALTGHFKKSSDLLLIQSLGVSLPLNYFADLKLYERNVHQRTNQLPETQECYHLNKALASSIQLVPKSIKGTNIN